MVIVKRVLTVIVGVLMLMSCSPENPESSDPSNQETDDSGNNDGKKEETKMKMVVGSYEFDVKYARTIAADTFMKMQPLTFNMKERNGNEKYCYIDFSMTTAPNTTGTINAGDIMLFGRYCLVVFYETFHTSYSYTPIGYIEDVSKLKEALGEGDVTIRFE